MLLSYLLMGVLCSCHYRVTSVSLMRCDAFSPHALHACRDATRRARPRALDAPLHHHGKRTEPHRYHTHTLIAIRAFLRCAHLLPAVPPYYLPLAAFSRTPAGGYFLCTATAGRCDDGCELPACGAALSRPSANGLPGLRLHYLLPSAYHGSVLRVRSAALPAMLRQLLLPGGGWPPPSACSAVRSVPRGRFRAGRSGDAGPGAGAV